jgi:long-chain acyl-CoA synthetase
MTDGAAPNDDAGDTGAMSWDDAVARVTEPGGRFSMTEAEINGHTDPVFENAPPSLRVLFELAGAGHGDKPFLVYEDERSSFAETVAAAGAVGHLLVDRYGIEPGDRVAIVMRNYPEWIQAFMAITSVGAIAVAVNAWWTTDELDYGLADCGARLVLVDEERIERVQPLRQDLGLDVVAVRTTGAVPEGVDRLEDVLDRSAPMPEVTVDPDDDAVILYTSGTTGHPKGAVSSHRAVITALMAFGCRAAVNAARFPKEREHPFDTAYILIVPLFHATGLIPVLLGCVAAGSKLVVMHKWDPDRALELIERERVTAFVGVPTMSWDLLQSPDFDRRDTSSLLSVGGGGAPAPPELVRRIEENFPRGRPAIGYGMTETNAYGPQNAGDDYVRKPKSTGRAVPALALQIQDEDGREVPRGEVGEICFKGASLIRGYWNKPEATAETIRDGWLRSGDIGRVDDEGFVYVEDRAKDMVLRAGENVYSAEVEAAIYEVPGVREAAVFGLPHERLGEEVACAVVTDGDFDRRAFQSHLAEKLAPFMIPSRVDLRTESLPRNANGKILKRTLRDELTDA